MRIIPLVKPIGTDTFFNSFILNSFCLAITATVAVEMRNLLDEKKGYIYTYLNSIIPGKDLSEGEKLIITFVTALVSAFLVYNLFYLLFGFGTGMLGEPSNKIKNHIYIK
jgi:hypothetical protein